MWMETSVALERSWAKHLRKSKEKKPNAKQIIPLYTHLLPILTNLCVS